MALKTGNYARSAKAIAVRQQGGKVGELLEENMTRRISPRIGNSLNVFDFINDFANDYPTVFAAVVLIAIFGYIFFGRGED